MPDPAESSRLAVGVMSGTSLDGLDAVLVHIDGRGLDLAVRLIGQASTALGDLADALRAAAEQAPMSAGEMARLAWAFAELHVEVIATLVRDTRPDLVAVHGQTVFHQPPISWQLVNPAPIEHRFRCPVIADLRQADLAAGGQGAPITPLADWVMFRSPDSARAIVNLGGFCNVTSLPRDCPAAGREPPDLASRIHGFDVCPCNQVLDAIARRAFGSPFDDGGRRAGAGTVRPDLVKSLIDVIAAQRRVRRSLGTGDEATDWTDRHLDRVPPADLAASACAAIARATADAIEQCGREHGEIEQVVLAGGGTRNAALVAALRAAVIQPITTSDVHGVPVDAREAMAMAILGSLRLDGVPITLPQVTGRDVTPSDASSLVLQKPAPQQPVR